MHQSSPSQPRLIQILANIAFGICATILGLGFGSALGLGVIFLFLS